MADEDRSGGVGDREGLRADPETVAPQPQRPPMAGDSDPGGRRVVRAAKEQSNVGHGVYGRGDPCFPGSGPEVDPADPVVVEIHGLGPRAGVGDIDSEAPLLAGDDRSEAPFVLDPDRESGLVTGRYTASRECPPVG